MQQPDHIDNQDIRDVHTVSQTLPRVDWSPAQNADTAWEQLPVPTYAQFPPYAALTGRWDVYNKAASPFAGDSHDTYMRRALSFAVTWAEEDANMAQARAMQQQDEERRRKNNAEAQARWRARQRVAESRTIKDTQDVQTHGSADPNPGLRVVNAQAALDAAVVQRREALQAMAAARAQWGTYIAGLRAELLAATRALKRS